MFANTLPCSKVTFLRVEEPFMPSPISPDINQQSEGLGNERREQTGQLVTKVL